MALNKYVGARYVTKIYENSQNPSSAEWEENVEFEPLTLVTYNNSSYLSRKPVPSNIGNPQENGSYWAMTGFYNGQITALQEQVALLNAAIQNTDSEIEEMKKDGKLLTGNLVLNDIYPNSTGAVQGSAYVGGNCVVTYFNKSGNNTGLLRCYNLNTFSVVWEYPITAYHGNGIAYEPDSNNIYICGAIDEVTSASINKIVEINLSSPNTVLREFALPEMNTVFSIVYDEENKCFYANTTENNKICIFDETLATKTGEFLIASDAYTMMQEGDAQGLSACFDGVIYLVNSNTKGRAIVGINLDGSLETVSTLPAFINKCRSIGETESVLYDFDNDRFLVSSVLYITGTYAYNCHMLFEVNLFKGVIEYEPVPSGDVYGQHSEGAAYLVCVNGANPLRPTWLLDRTIVPLPNDALNYAKLRGDSIRLRMENSRAGLTKVTDRMANLQINGFMGRIEGDSNASKIKIRNMNITDFTAVSFLNCIFEKWVVGNNTYNVVVGQNAKVFIQRCVFEDLGTTSNAWHVVAGTGADVKVYQGTFEGQATANTDAYETGTVVVA